MKRLLLFLLLAFGAQAAPTNSIVFNFEDFTAQPSKVRQFTLYRLPPSATNGSGSIIALDRISKATGTNGSVTVSNMYGGPYRSELMGPSITTTNFFVFPTTNGVQLNASDWMSSASAASQPLLPGIFKAQFVDNIATNKIPLAGVTNAGNIAYSNAVDFVRQRELLPILQSNAWTFGKTNSGQVVTIDDGTITSSGLITGGGGLAANNIYGTSLSDNTAIYAAPGTKALTSIANGGANTVLRGGTPPIFAPMTNMTLYGTTIVSNLVDVQNVKFWGAVGDGATDDTLAISNCFRDTVLLGNRARIYFPKGDYKTSSELSLSNAVGFTIFGDGKESSRIIQYGTSARSVLNLIGANRIRFESICFMSSTNGVTPPKCILILGRHTVGDSDSDHQFENVRIEGFSTISTYYNVASEGTLFNGCDFILRGGGATNVVYVGQSDDFNVGPLPTSTMLLHHIDGCNIISLTNGDVIRINAAVSTGNFSVRNSYLSGGTEAGVRIVVPSSTISDGPFDFNDIRYESIPGAKYAFYLDGTNSFIDRLAIKGFHQTSSPNVPTNFIYGVDTVTLRDFQLERVYSQAISTIDNTLNGHWTGHNLTMRQAYGTGSSQLDGTMHVFGTNGYLASILLDNHDGGNWHLLLKANSTIGGGGIDTGNSDPLVLQSAGGPTYITGKAGIGTTSPDTQLHVRNSSAAQATFSGWDANGASDNSGAINIGATAAFQGAIHYEQAGATRFLFDNTYDNGAAKTIFRMRTSGTPLNVLTLDGAGNVGINNASPVVPLDVTGNIRASATILPTNGLILTSNVFPVTSWSALGNSGCITWMSNNIAYLICTNSANGTATTNIMAASLTGLQTPWASDIDALNHGLTNASVISSGTNVSLKFIGDGSGLTNLVAASTNATAVSNIVVDIGNPNTDYTFPLISGSGTQRLEVQGGTTSLLRFNPNTHKLSVPGGFLVGGQFIGDGAGLTNLSGIGAATNAILMFNGVGTNTIIYEAATITSTNTATGAILTVAGTNNGGNVASLVLKDALSNETFTIAMQASALGPALNFYFRSNIVYQISMDGLQGVGLTNPAHALDIKGDIRATNILASQSITATNGYFYRSNAFPFTAWSELGNCGCVTWMSNATLYLICTNSINSNATTNKLGGL